MTGKADTTQTGDNDISAPRCGIIMPIAAMPAYEAEHWSAILELINRAVGMASMEPQPVWEGGAADVLQERIVRNLYELPFAVCDISGQNPNVMLELGIRLAFGKPTVIINDGEVRAPFDINSIEYVQYSRGLHFLKAEELTSKLTKRLAGLQTAVNAGTYKPYIKTFGPIDLGTPGDEAIPLGRVVLDQLEQLAGDVRRLTSTHSLRQSEFPLHYTPPRSSSSQYVQVGTSPYSIRIKGNRDMFKAILPEISASNDVKEAYIHGPDLIVNFTRDLDSTNLSLEKLRIQGLVSGYVTQRWENGDPVLINEP